MRSWGKRSFLFILALLLIASCRTATDPATPEPIQPSQKATSTEMPVTQTVEPETPTPTPRPTDTLAPTASHLPATPTPTAEPLLPPDLPIIGPDNIEDLEVLSVLPVKEIYALTFSQSGNKLATLSEHWQDRSDYLEVWDLMRGERTLFLEDLDAPWNPYFPPDENQLFVSYANQGIDIYDLIQQKLARTLGIRANWSAYSPDGQSIATGNYLGSPDESIVRVLDLATEQELFATTRPGMVMKLEFSPDGRLLAGGFQGPNHFRDFVWELATQELVADFIDYETSLTFSPKNNLVATTKGGKVYIFSSQEWALRYSYGFADPYSNVRPKNFTQDGDILAVVDRNHVIFLETASGEELFRLPDECDLRLSPTGMTLVTWCYQGELKIWGVTP